MMKYITLMVLMAGSGFSWATWSSSQQVGSLVGSGFDAPDPDPRKVGTSPSLAAVRAAVWRCTRCRQAFGSDHALRAHSRDLRHDTVIWPEQT